MEKQILHIVTKRMMLRVHLFISVCVGRWTAAESKKAWVNNVCTDKEAQDLLKLCHQRGRRTSATAHRTSCTVHSLLLTSIMTLKPRSPRRRASLLQRPTPAMLTSVLLMPAILDTSASNASDCRCQCFHCQLYSVLGYCPHGTIV